MKVYLHVALSELTREQLELPFVKTGRFSLDGESKLCRLDDDTSADFGTMMTEQEARELADSTIFTNMEGE